MLFNMVMLMLQRRYRIPTQSETMISLVVAILVVVGSRILYGKFPDMPDTVRKLIEGIIGVACFIAGSNLIISLIFGTA